MGRLYDLEGSDVSLEDLIHSSAQRGRAARGKCAYTPWPWSPSVIAYVEEYEENGGLTESYYEVRHPDASTAVRAYGHDAAVELALRLKAACVSRGGGHDERGATREGLYRGLDRKRSCE